MRNTFLLSPLVLTLLAVSVSAAPTAPLYTVKIEAGTTKVISYRHLSGSTDIDFRGTPLASTAKGEAEVASTKGAIQIDARFENLEPANKYGPEYMTYVLWSISPEGRATNLGELILDGNKSRLNVTTQLQAFALIVTAEPYYAVTQVSNVVVMENTVNKDTKGKVEEMTANFDLLERGQYSLNRSPEDLKPVKMDKKIPAYVYQARNAIGIAKATGADVYATDTYNKADALLKESEDRLLKRKNTKTVSASAREAIQTAEDARLIAVKRAAENSVNEKLSKADNATQQATDTAALAQASATQAQAEAANAKAAVAQSEDDKAKLREQLRAQLNAVLETRETARGLIVSMPDVLFATGKYDLKEPVREKLAKVSGIVLGHPTLKLQVEGHTDSVGSDEYNQTLSEHRAGAVRDYMVKQGIAADSVVARGLGETKPMSSNDTAEGRQQNRRVEIVVSGDEIGTTSKL